MIFSPDTVKPSIPHTLPTPGMSRGEGSPVAQDFTNRACAPSRGHTNSTPRTRAHMRFRQSRALQSYLRGTPGAGPTPPGDLQLLFGGCQLGLRSRASPRLHPQQEGEVGEPEQLRPLPPLPSPAQRAPGCSPSWSRRTAPGGRAQAPRGQRVACSSSHGSLAHDGPGTQP